MLYTLKEVMDLGEKGNFAIPAFNVYTAENAIAVIQAAEEMRAPVIIQMYSRLFDSGIAKFLAPSILKAIDEMSVPCAFHLDHGANEGVVTRAIRYGASGVMIDTSTLELDDNIAVTKRVVDMASAAGVSVEGELGHIGSAANGDENGSYTEVADAVKYVNETGIAALAIMVGTAHGHYKQTPKLAIDRIAEIHAATKAHLVLHGGSGVPDDQMQAAVNAGIRKVNFGTDVCYSYIDGCKQADPTKMALDVYLRYPTETVKQFAIEKIKLLGADGQV